MNKLLVIAALTLASTSALASKARLTALGSSAHLVDVQTVFVNPSDLNLMGSWATFEMGGTNGALATVTPNAEAGFSRANGDARWGFYLGHTGTATSLRGTAAAGIFQTEENPINLFYAAKMADISWGLGLNYSNTDKKATGKQSTMGLTGGMRMGPWDAALSLGLSDTAEVGTRKWTGKNAMDLRAGYVMDAWYFFGAYGMNGGKDETAGVTAADLDNSNMRLGMVNTTKVDGGEFFWGASYSMDKTENKTTATKTETTSLPVVIGIEADAASWLVLRGSVTQNVLLGSSKVGAADATTIANNTTVQAGAGVKFNKFMLDGTLAGSTTGAVNGTSLLATAALTYNF